MEPCVRVHNGNIANDSTSRLAAARRKRRESRRFEKGLFASQVPSSEISNLVIKRTRRLSRSRSICASVCISSYDALDARIDTVDGIKLNHDKIMAFASQLIREIKGSSKFLGHAYISSSTINQAGLVRSMSFPPSKTSIFHNTTKTEVYQCQKYDKFHLSTIRKHVHEKNHQCGDTLAPDTHQFVDKSANFVTEAEPKVMDVTMFLRPVGNYGSSNIIPEIVNSVSKNGATCPPSGKMLTCGRRKRMEDTAVIVPSFAKLTCNGSVNDLHFFAVYDGHGGSQASSYCAERFHHALEEEISRSFISQSHITKDESEWRNVMVSCFHKMDKEVGGVCPNGACDSDVISSSCCSNAIAPGNVGTTAVVAVVSDSQIIVANCGDSRAVLSRCGKAIPLSNDHKPEREDETTRIEAAGGRVIFWEGYRVGGLLAMSRAIGDRYLKRYVVSEPDVICLPRSEEDECLILASDGLWDVISNETACQIARKCLATARKKYEGRTIQSSNEDMASTSVAGLLVKLACGKGSSDNVSVVVIDLKRQSKHLTE